MRKTPSFRRWSWILILLLAACSDSSKVDGEDQDAGPPDAGPSPIAMASCDSTPPEGAAKPAELPDYSQGTCPEVSIGRNTIESVTGTREFLLIVPEDMEPDEELPLARLSRPPLTEE